MNKYQPNPTNQPKAPKKPAHLKKNPLAHAIWLADKEARNQAQYQQRRQKCLICQQPSQKAYFEEGKPQVFFCQKFSCFQQ